MKRKGFTLSELIVALGIIGVVAAVAAPMINGIIPDKDKVLVLKVKRELSLINSDLLNNPTYYPKYDSTGTKKIGLDNTDISSDWPSSMDYTASNKYPLLVASQLSLTGDPATDGEKIIIFRTNDGLSWKFDTTTAPPYILTVDKDGFYVGKNSSAVKNADQFVFNIDTRGNVTGADALTRAYLNNPHKLNDRKADYKAAGIK